MIGRKRGIEFGYDSADNINNIKGKSILVVGMGKSGIACSLSLLKLGAEISIQDNRAEEELDPNTITFLRNQGAKCYFHKVPSDMSQFDMVVLSPGVSPELEFIREAREAGVEISGELEIAYRIGKGNYVAITGTNGKTTTTALVGEIFKLSGRITHVVGNIGVAVISASADAKEDHWLVTEVSSFQLETTRYFRPRVSAILNLTPDHLNRHHTMEAYGDAKAKVYANQRDDGYFIYNFDDEELKKIIKRNPPKAKLIPFSRTKNLREGAVISDKSIVIREEDGLDIDICDVEDINLIGDHNLENVLAAAAICYYSGIDPQFIAEGICAFRGVEHRIELCGNTDGIKFYNDSKGTNTDATITALKAFDSPVILIAGGDGKGQDFSALAKESKGRVKKYILLGKDAELIAEALKREDIGDYIYCKNMEECVAQAKASAVEGDVVLLSPACASWDMYENYEQRGTHFKSCVALLEK